MQTCPTNIRLCICRLHQQSKLLSIDQNPCTYFNNLHCVIGPLKKVGRASERGPAFIPSELSKIDITPAPADLRTASHYRNVDTIQRHFKGSALKDSRGTEHLCMMACLFETMCCLLGCECGRMRALHMCSLLPGSVPA